MNTPARRRTVKTAYKTFISAIPGMYKGRKADVASVLAELEKSKQPMVAAKRRATAINARLAKANIKSNIEKADDEIDQFDVLLEKYAKTPHHHITRRLIEGCRRGLHPKLSKDQGKMVAAVSLCSRHESAAVNTKAMADSQLVCQHVDAIQYLNDRISFGGADELIPIRDQWQSALDHWKNHGRFPKDDDVPYQLPVHMVMTS